MKVIVVPSRGVAEIPVNELLHNGRLNINAEIETRDYLRFHFRGRNLEIVAGKYVGLIPVTPTILADVQPKLPVSNLERVVHRSQLHLDNLPTARRSYAASDTVSSSAVEFLARGLLDATRDIIASGLWRDYQSRRRIAPTFRGRLLRSDTLRHRMKHPMSPNVVSVPVAATVDNSINRVLKFALVELSRLLSRSRLPARRGTMSAINETLRWFEGVRVGCTAAEIAAVKRLVRTGRTPRTYYVRALEIALFVLGQKGISLVDRSPEAVELASYVIDFENLFERYLRNTLSMLSGSFVVRDGNRDGGKWLFDEKCGPKANPDMVLLDAARRCVGLVEVKYKDRLDRSDVNQCLAYGFSYRVPVVILVRQRKGHELREQLIGTIGDVTLVEYRFDLANSDLPGEEDQFVRTVSAHVGVSAAP